VPSCLRKWMNHFMNCLAIRIERVIGVWEGVHSLHSSCGFVTARGKDRTNPRPPWFAPVASLSGMVQSKPWLSFSSAPLPLHGRGFQNWDCESMQAFSMGIKSFTQFPLSQVHD
jgi:hypothetical protein